MLEEIIKGVLPILERVIPDKGERARLAHELAVLQQQREQEIITAQLAVNKAEAQHRSLLVAGWRPAVGWTCAAAFACNFVILPLWGSLAPVWDIHVAIAPLDLGEVMPVLLGMLGLGGYRSWEKSKGLTR